MTAAAISTTASAISTTVIPTATAMASAATPSATSFYIATNFTTVAGVMASATTSAAAIGGVAAAWQPMPPPPRPLDPTLGRGPPPWLPPPRRPPDAPLLAAAAAAARRLPAAAAPPAVRRRGGRPTAPGASRSPPRRARGTPSGCPPVPVRGDPAAPWAGGAPSAVGRWGRRRPPCAWQRVIFRVVAGGSHGSPGASVVGDTPHGRPSAPAAPRVARAAPSPCNSHAKGGAGSRCSRVCSAWCGERRGGPWPRVRLHPDGSARAPAKAPPPAPGRRHASSLMATALRAHGGGGCAPPSATSAVRSPAEAAGGVRPRPPAGECPRAGRAATTDGGPRTAGRLLAAGLGGSRHSLYGWSFEWWGGGAPRGDAAYGTDVGGWGDGSPPPGHPRGDGGFTSSDGCGGDADSDAWPCTTGAHVPVASARRRGTRRLRRWVCQPRVWRRPVAAAIPITAGGRCTAAGAARLLRCGRGGGGVLRVRRARRRGRRRIAIASPPAGLSAPSQPPAGVRGVGYVRGGVEATRRAALGGRAAPDTWRRRRPPASAASRGRATGGEPAALAHRVGKWGVSRWRTSGRQKELERPKEERRSAKEKSLR